MLETERLDVVQVCARCDRIPHWTRLCLERGLAGHGGEAAGHGPGHARGAVPAARKTKAALVPMHTMRGVPELAAVRQAVRAGESATR